MRSMPLSANNSAGLLLRPRPTGLHLQTRERSGAWLGRVVGSIKLEEVVTVRWDQLK